MDRGEALTKLAEQRKDIPKYLEVCSVRNILKNGIAGPAKLSEKVGGLYVDTSASLMEVCDHLGLEYVKQEDYRGMEVVSKKVTEKGGLFSLEPGEEVTVIKVRKDMNIKELVELMAKIREISATKLTNPIDLKQMQEWAERVGGYSKKLREAGLAMERVRQLTPNPNKQWDELYSQTAETVFALGEAISLERRINKPSTLADAYKELLSEQGKEGIDNYLISGLNYARYGEKKKQIQLSPKEAFEKMAKVSARLAKGESPVGMTAAILDTIIGQSLPKQIDKVKQDSQESREQTEKIPAAFAIEIALRGVEKMYQELPIPVELKELLKLDIEQLSKKDREELIKKFSEPRWRRQVSILLEKFSIVYTMSSEEEKTRWKSNPNPSLSEMEKYKTGPKAVTEFLTKWQDHLRTMGLGKENIHKFSQWLEDPEFFDQAKIDLLKRKMYYHERKLYWEKDPGIKSVKQVNEYYQQQQKVDEKVQYEYGMFQLEMLRMVVEQMRTMFGGWDKEAFFVGLMDSSPSKIIQRMQLNCVGRSNLLLAAAELFGCHGRGVLTYAHMATSFKLAQGETFVVDPSQPYGSDIFGPHKLPDPEGLLRKGEVIYKDWAGVYLETDPALAIAAGVMGNLVYETNGSNIDLNRINNLLIKLAFGPTEIASYFRVGGWEDQTPPQVLKEMAMIKNTSEADIIFAVKRLNLLCPDYLDRIKNNPMQREMIKKLMKAAGIDK